MSWKKKYQFRLIWLTFDPGCEIEINPYKNHESKIPTT